MPFARDKIIINSNETEGTHALIQGEYKSLNHLGEEIESQGWGPETQDFRDEMERLCEAHHDADLEYYDGLRSLRKRMDVWVNEKHAAKHANAKP